MPYSGKDFMDQGAPIGDLCRFINKTFYGSYEWDRDNYHHRLDKYQHDEVPGEVWGIDQAQLQCSNSTWGSSLEELQDHVLYHVVANALDNSGTLESFFSDDISQEQHDSIARNLSNAWRDEFALNDPIEGDVDDRMRTTEWRIVMCYYSVFKAQSALMYCKFEDIRADGSGGSHTRMWKKHRRKMMAPLGNSLYAYPFMFFPQATKGKHSSNWFDWTVPYPVPETDRNRQERVLKVNAKRNLEDIYNKLENFDWTNDAGLNTFYDGLLMIRKWANYQHGGVFSRLYGEGYKQAIDEALRLLTYTALAIAEVGIIMAYGWKRFNGMWNVYWANSHAGVADSYSVAKRRVTVYHEAFS